MRELEVNCISTVSGRCGHEHITHIGHWVRRWRISRETAIARIEAGVESYFTIDKSNGKRYSVGVVRDAGKLPYLRAHEDGKWNDHLLLQVECPDKCATLG